jgi:hypothetical protein
MSECINEKDTVGISVYNFNKMSEAEIKDIVDHPPRVFKLADGIVEVSFGLPSKQWEICMEYHQKPVAGELIPGYGLCLMNDEGGGLQAFEMFFEGSFFENARAWHFHDKDVHSFVMVKWTLDEVRKKLPISVTMTRE